MLNLFLNFPSDNRKSKTCPELGQNPKWLRLLAFVIAFVMCGAMAQAQQPKKVSRLGYLSSADAATDSDRAEGIRLALRDLGYIEGQNIVIEYRYAKGRPEREPGLAAELVRLKIDIIVVATGGP